MSSTPELEAISLALAAPFDESEVRFKPAVVKGDRALALHYIDARVVMDRLDEAVGATNWQDLYEFLPDGSCMCKLSLRIGGEWLTKMDVGGKSEQDDEGDQRKAAVSDALKRAAVKWGVGRYLYRLPQQWCDYDQQKKQFTRKPTLPGQAAAKAKPAAPKQEAAALAESHPNDRGEKPAAPPGWKFLRSLDKGEAEMVKLRWCAAGELLEHVRIRGQHQRYPLKIENWNAEQIADGLACAGEFKALAKANHEQSAA